MSACLGFSWRGALISVALVSGFGDAARASFFDDVADFFSNAPEVATTNFCRNFAIAGVSAARKAQNLKCPLGGRRYTTDENAHYFWCMGVEPDTTRAEWEARDRQVQTCGDYWTEAYVYGEHAAEAIRDNKLYNCGFTGPRWEGSSAKHREDFLIIKITQRDNGKMSYWPQPEFDARLEMISQCKAKYSEKKKQFCNLYATEAVESLNKFKQMKCVGSQNESRLWPSDYDTHFSWCIGLSKGVGRTASKASIERVNAETQKHRDSLKACITRNELITRGKESPTNKLYSGPNRRSLEDFSKVAPPSAPAKPKPTSNSGPGTGGIYLSKPGGGNSAMDRLTGGRELPSGGGGGVSTSRPAPRPSAGGTPSAQPIAAPAPAPAPYGGGIYTTKPNPPTFSGGINKSR